MSTPRPLSGNSSNSVNNSNNIVISPYTGGSNTSNMNNIHYNSSPRPFPSLHLAPSVPASTSSFPSSSSSVSSVSPNTATPSAIFPPSSFAMLADGLYRSAAPTPLNIEVRLQLASMNLNTTVFLIYFKMYLLI